MLGFTDESGVESAPKVHEAFLDAGVASGTRLRERDPPNLGEANGAQFYMPGRSGVFRTRSQVRGGAKWKATKDRGTAVERRFFVSSRGRGVRCLLTSHDLPARRHTKAKKNRREVERAYSPEDPHCGRELVASAAGCENLCFTG